AGAARTGSDCARSRGTATAGRRPTPAGAGSLQSGHGPCRGVGQAGGRRTAGSPHNAAVEGQCAGAADTRTAGLSASRHGTPATTGANRATGAANGGTAARRPAAAFGTRPKGSAFGQPGGGGFAGYSRIPAPPGQLDVGLKGQ